MTAADPLGGTLPFRNAFADHDHVASNLVAHGRDAETPHVTIAITTFKRYDLIVESMQSALAQDFDRPFEIIVLDNDPDSPGAALLLENLPELATRNFRYFVNAENMGVFGNFNRCIKVARGAWLTILNDDDLLDPDFLQTMFQTLDADASIDGIVSLKRIFTDGEQRIGPASQKPASHKPMSRSVLLELLTSASGRSALLGRLHQRARLEWNCRGGASRRIPARIFFWGAVVGNGSGFLFRPSKALEIGGFYPEEYPSADLWFFARFALAGHLRQHRRVAVSIRKTENSITRNTILTQIEKGYRLQHRLAGTVAPRWWRRLLPTMIAQYRYDFVREWGAPVSEAEVESALGIKLPPYRPRTYKMLRALLGGY